jgi:hypothetical protein
MKTRMKPIKELAILAIISIVLALPIAVTTSVQAASFGSVITSAGFQQKFGEKALGDTTGRLMYAVAIHFLFFEPLRKNVDNLPTLILMNPVMMTEENGEFIPNTALNNLVETFIKITIPFYLLAIIAVAVYLLFVSGSPLGRARAKSSLIKLVISMGVIFLTIPIIQLLLDISSSLTSEILNLTDTSVGLSVLKGGIDNMEKMYATTTTFNYWNSLYLLMFSGIMFASLFLMLALRYFLVIYFTVLFPVSIMLYAFYFTRRIGAQMFRTTLAWIFVQPVMALLLVAISIARYTMPMQNDDTVVLCFSLAAFMCLVVSPLIVTKVMDWLAMLMVVLTAIEFPGLHGIIGMIDELQVEGPKTEEITPPHPIKPK